MTDKRAGDPMENVQTFRNSMDSLIEEESDGFPEERLVKDESQLVSRNA